MSSLIFEMTFLFTAILHYTTFTPHENKHPATGY